MKYTFLAVLSAVTVLATPAPVPTPPNIPSASTAQSLLSGLTVRPQGPQDGYSRDKFPHWITISGTCNTRETVLRRDGTNVQVDGSCAAISGSWFSPYDGATWTAASDVDIDHVVPLSNAWKSGAASWTTSQRQSFANDLSNPQLIAVTDNVSGFHNYCLVCEMYRVNKSINRSTRPRATKARSHGSLHFVSFFKYWIIVSRPITDTVVESYWCTYSRMWIKVKSVYKLSVTSAEKSALTSMLNTC